MTPDIEADPVVGPGGRVAVVMCRNRSENTVWAPTIDLPLTPVSAVAIAAATGRDA